MSIELLFGASIYCVVFLFVVLGIWMWQLKRKNERPPLEFKLLRGPGESLRQRMVQFDDQFTLLFSISAAAPLLAAAIVIRLLIWLTPKLPAIYGLAITAVPTVVVLILAGRYAMQKLTRYRNDKLGYLGERAVGEALEELRAGGYAVFHDIPAEVGGWKFNVDHVVIGKNGVFALETKTRRKGRARPGFEPHKVAYDGRQLIWPWAEDSYGLTQAIDRARWLSEWLSQMTCATLNAKPVLVLPGWYVVPKGLGPVLVVNHNQLAGAISRHSGSTLTKEQIRLIARQLEARCRDVTD